MNQSKNILTLVFALSCAQPVIKNDTDIWTKYDQKVLQSAKERCPIHYAKSPCVKLFWKVQPRLYRVLCGKEK